VRRELIEVIEGNWLKIGETQMSMSRYPDRSCSLHTAPIHILTILQYLMPIQKKETNSLFDWLRRLRTSGIIVDIQRRVRSDFRFRYSKEYVVELPKTEEGSVIRQRNRVVTHVHG
jgi:hypothetical protein